ncbi:MAG: hypothetical protein ACUVRD_08255 [Bacteroidia bacterium]
MAKMVIAFVFIFLGCNSSRKAPPPPADTLTKVSPKDTLPRLAASPFWNDLARIFGGIMPQDTLFWRETISHPGFKKHRDTIQEIWKRKSEKLFLPLRNWAQKELDTFYTYRGKVFYPFSGADWPSIYALHPNGSTYLFFGLELEGNPDLLRQMPPAEVPKHLQSVTWSMLDLLRLSFFKTKEMQSYSVATQIKGLLPVFLGFLARTGHEIYEVERGHITASGWQKLPPTLHNRPQTPYDTLVTGIKIVFGLPGHAPQTLYFLSFNASNSGLRNNPNLVKFLQAYKPAVTFIKAASYLMFNAEFDHMRQLLLAASEVITQEDCGIPYRYFDTLTWKAQLYGVYNQPIQLFRRHFQKDLWEAYRQPGVKPLPFTIGYHTVPGQSNLMIFIRKKAG